MGKSGGRLNMAKIKYTKTAEGTRVEISYKGFYDGLHTLNKEIGKIRSKIAKKYELIAEEERKIADAYFEIGRCHKAIGELKRLEEDTSMIPTLQNLVNKLTAEKDEKEKQEGKK